MRWLRRAVILPPALLLTAYVTLPWWLPTDWLHGQIVSQLQNDLGRPVSLARLTVSWSEGVVLEDLRVRQSEGFGPGDLLRIGRLSCPFTPLRTAALRRLGRLELSDCLVEIVRNESGQLNIADLKPPLSSLRVEQVSCDGARVILVNRKSRQTAELRLGTVDWRLDPGVPGLMRTAVSGESLLQSGPNGRRELGHFSVNADVIDPFARSAGGGLQQGGDLRLSWQTVDLASLTVHDWRTAQALGVLELAGRCGGTLQVKLDPSGRVAWGLAATFQDLKARLARAVRSVDIPAGTLELAGQYDIPSLRNTIEQVAIEAPGVSLRAGVDIRPAEGNYLRLRIEQARLRPQPLGRMAPDLLAWLDPKWAATGELALKGQVEWSDAFRRVDLELDGTGLGLSCPDVISKPEGLAARAEVRGEYQQDLDRLTVSAMSVRFGQSEATVRAEADELYPVMVGRKKVWDVWLDWLAEVSVRTEDAKELLEHLPLLRKAVGATELSGPARFRAQFVPVSEQVNWARQVRCRQLLLMAEAGQASRLVLAGPAVPLVEKRSDEPVSVTVECRFAPDSPTIQSGRAVFRRGAEQDPDAATVELSPLSGKLAVSYPADPGPPGASRPEMNLVFDGELTCRRIERLVSLSPRLAQFLQSPRPGETAELSGGFTGQANLRLGREQVRLRLALDLAGLGARLASGPLASAIGGRFDGRTPPTVLVKSPGEPAKLEMNYSAYPAEANGPAGGDTSQFTRGRIDWEGLGLSASAEAWSATAGTADDRQTIQENRVASFAISDIQSVLAHMPALGEQVRLAGWELAGKLAGAATWRPGPDHAIRIELDAGALDARGPAGPTGPAGRLFQRKPAGVSCRLDAELLTNLPNAPAQPRVTIQHARAELGASDLTLHGTVVLLPVWWAAFGETGRNLDRPPPIERMDLTINGQIAVEHALLAELSPRLADRLAGLGMDGRAGIAARLTGGWPLWRLQLDLDGHELAIDLPGRVSKPRQAAAKVHLDASVSPRLEVWQVPEASLRCEGVELVGRGQLRRRTDAAEAGPAGTIANAQLALDVKVADLERLARLCPALLSRPDLLSGPVSGRVDGRLNLFAETDADGALRPVLLPSQLDLADVRCVLAGTDLSADGRVELSQREVFVPHLALRLGSGETGPWAQVGITARVNAPGGRPAGRIDLAGQSLDLDELKGLWGRLARAGPPRPGDDAHTARSVVEFLARCDIRGKVRLANLSVTDTKNQTRYRLNEFQSDFILDTGQIRVPFQTAMEGGVLTGQVSSRLTDEAPMLLTRYEAYRLFPTKNVQPIVEAFFPGMTINGHVTMKEQSRQKLLPAPGETNWPVGSGEVIFEDGLMVGQAGPDWMVKVFPGLKLTHYRFALMHNWFTLSPDGRANHHMIFAGQSYDIYMIGWTHRGTGQARYTVGVDLLASLDSRTWSVELHQGKIPLMYVSGRIENRQLKDAEYTMVLPPVALWQMLIRDNILYRGVIERALKRLARQPKEPDQQE